MSEPRYSVGTWDHELGAFTPQAGFPWWNLTKQELRKVLRMLQNVGYSCHRKRDRDGDYDSDPSVLVERTDGESYWDILRRWKESVP